MMHTFLLKRGQMKAGYVGDVANIMDEGALVRIVKMYPKQRGQHRAFLQQRRSKSEVMTL